MEQQQTPNPPATTDAPPPPQSQQQQAPIANISTPAATAVTLSSPSAATSSSPSLSVNPNPNPNPTPVQTLSLKASSSPSISSPQLQQSQAQPRPSPSALSRPWQQHSTFSHFSSPLASPSSSSSSSSSPSISSPASPSLSAPQRGGMAIGVPAAPHPSPSPPTSQPSAFSGSFGQQFGGLGRSGISVPESASNANVSQPRPIQGIQGMGMMGTLGSSSQMRPGGISAHHQQRPVQSTHRPPSSPTSQPSGTQNFQGHSLLRVSSVVSPASSAPNTSQSTQSLNQPWLSSGPQGKPPLPPSSFRPQMNSPSMQPRSHIPQQHHSLPPASQAQQQQMSSAQPQQTLPSHQPQEHFGQKLPSRTPQSSPLQQQVMRVQGSASQKSSSLIISQPNPVQPAAQSKPDIAESDKPGGRILSKRSIHELVSQIDPSEKLDAEVEDILVDIAEDFVDSITTFGCSLAKHRKSDTLEAKDILLHLERNWNMSLPGFGGDEIKTFRKPHVTDIHKERLAVIKKSIIATEVTSTKNPVGQVVTNVKGNLAKTPANLIGSPNFKTREVT